MGKKDDKIDQIIRNILTNWENNSNFRNQLHTNSQKLLENLFREMNMADKKTKSIIATIATKVKNNREQQLKEFLGKKS